MYHYTRRMEDGTELNDGSHIIFVNGSYTGDDDIGRLIRDLHEKDPGNMTNSILADTVSYFKSSGEEKEMLREMVDEIVENNKDEWLAEGIEQGIEKGREAGREEQAVSTAISMLALGKLSHEEISQCSGLPIEKIEELAKGNGGS